MSIIYDALKKAEKNINPESGKPDKPQKEPVNESKKTERKLFLVYALIICLTLFLANLAYTLLTSYKNKTLLNFGKTASAKKTGSVPSSQPAPLNPAKLMPNLPPSAPANTNPVRESHDSFVLNGTFASENEGYALINNQIVKQGDTVDGAVVKRISADEVDLDQEGKIIKLYSR